MMKPSEYPAERTSSLEFRARFCETDLMGIVHHSNYFQYFEMGRVDWLRKRGVTYAAWAERGTHLPVVESSARYRAPARFDDLLIVTTTLTELRSHSLRFAYRLTRDETLLAEGETRLACVDGAQKLVPFTGELRSVLTSGEIA
ncbi:MAG: thioesterase family protein [Polyangiaceae bacterium]